MCHTEIPSGQTTPTVERREIGVRLSEGEEMPALEVGSRSDPGVLLIADIYGRSPFYEHLAASLADKGLHVILPEFFFRQGPLQDGSRAAAFARRASLDEVRSVEDMREALRFLGGFRPDAAVGVVGFCMGGTFALDLASTEPDLVTVAFYGFPVHPEFVVSPPAAPMDVVDGLRGPVLALWGEDDETVGIDNVRRYVESAAAANPQFRHEILPGLGHGFLGSADLSDPADLAGVTWQRALAHLHQHLYQRSANGHA
jgi:dienelactone hydrolase